MSELLLNQFEQDRALVALRYKNLNIRKLFGKSVFIAGGGELAFSLVSSLRMVNLKKQADIAVFLLVEDNESYDRRFDYIDSSDFSIVKYSSLNAVNKCGDILIETGFLLSDRVEDVDVFNCYSIYTGSSMANCIFECTGNMQIDIDKKQSRKKK